MNKTSLEANKANSQERKVARIRIDSVRLRHPLPRLSTMAVALACPLPTFIQITTPSIQHPDKAYRAFRIEIRLWELPMTKRWHIHRS